MKTRLPPVILKKPIWITELATMMTNRPPMMHAKDLGARHDRDACDRAAEREGARVSHEDLGGLGVPPQEANARPRDRRGKDREVARVPHLVTRAGSTFVDVRTSGCSCQMFTST